MWKTENNFEIDYLMFDVGIEVKIKYLQNIKNNLKRIQYRAVVFCCGAFYENA